MNDANTVSELIKEGLRCIKDRDYRWAQTYFMAAQTLMDFARFKKEEDDDRGRTINNN